MAKKKALSKSLFFQMLSKRSKLTEKTVRRLYEQLFLLIAEELKFNGEIDLPDICKIYTKQQGGVDKRAFGEYVFVEAYDALKFKCKSRLLDYVNGKAVSKQSKVRKKSGRLSKNDIKLNNWSYENRQKDFEGYLDKIEREALEKGLKSQNRISREQLVRLVSKYSGMTQDSVRKMQESEENIIRYQLKNGKRIGYGNIGKFELKYRAGRDERDGVNPHTLEPIFIEAEEPRYIPNFSFLPAFKEEIRELTKDNFV